MKADKLLEKEEKPQNKNLVSENNKKYMKAFKLKDFLIEKLIFIAGISTIFFVLFIVVYLLYDAIPLFFEYSIIDFLFGPWNPASPTNPTYGIIPLLYGTLLVTGIALLISVPIGIASAIYIAQIASRREKEILKPLMELLAGIPSVIYGFFAMVILGVVLKNLFGLTFKLNAFNGGLIIGIMALPTIISISEDAITAVPKGFNEAALALGSSRWESIIGVMVPAAKSGIVASVMLGLGRAIGETMAVIMATGNSPQILYDLFAPVQTLTSPPALEMGEVAFGSTHYHALFAVCLVLFIITMMINVLADFIIKGGFKRKKKLAAKETSQKPNKIKELIFRRKNNGLKK